MHNTLLEHRNLPVNFILKLLQNLRDLGLVIYEALDYGIGEDEERQLSEYLENFMDYMTNGGDEGIEAAADDDDEQPASMGLGDEILEMCEMQLSAPEEARYHYRNVCRAMVAEALELNTFMEKISSYASEEDAPAEILELGMQEWAHIWLQTMHELRLGVKLKKTNFTKTPVEYELTPYEVLMEDIRERRYTLNKVQEEAHKLTRQESSDPRGVMLNFIRSRPPLKPVSERQLAPKRDDSLTPREKLQQEIKNFNNDGLRKTNSPVKYESSRTDLGAASPKRRQPSKLMIYPEDMKDLLNFDIEDDLESTASSTYSRQTSRNEANSDEDKDEDEIDAVLLSKMSESDRKKSVARGNLHIQCLPDLTNSNESVLDLQYCFTS